MAQPKRARRPANVCVLCGALGASDEDAVPTWVNDMFRRMGPGPYARIRDGVMTVPTPNCAASSRVAHASRATTGWAMCSRMWPPR